MIELLPAQARRYEPLVALDSGPDGLELQRRVAAAALQWLAPGGHLLIETSRHQLPRTVDIVNRARLRTRIAQCELLDAKVVIGFTQAGVPRQL
jgi:release factor glutamine methyltransferase